MAESKYDLRCTVKKNPRFPGNLGTIDRNININNLFGEGQEGNKDSQRESLHLFREYINNDEYNIHGNMDIVKAFLWGVGWEWGRVGRNWKQGNTRYNVTKNLAELCSTVLFKVELVSNETGYLAVEILSKVYTQHRTASLLRVKCVRKELI